MRPEQHLETFLNSAVSLIAPPQPQSWTLCTHDRSGRFPSCRCSQPQLCYTVLSGEPFDGIGRLPTETITEVLAFALALHPVLDGDDREASVWERVKFAIGITHVCQRWRNILINAPPFRYLAWNAVPRSKVSLHLFDLLNRRSGQEALSLNVTFYTQERDYSKEVYKLESAADKIEQLYISHWHGQRFSIFPFESFFPLLHTLVLDKPHDGSESKTRYEDYCHDTIDEATLGLDQLPALCALRITSHTHLRPTRLADTMQELTLSCVRHVSDMLQTLAHLPHLRVLEIARMHNPEDTFTTEGVPPCALHTDPRIDPDHQLVHVALDELELFTIGQGGAAALRTFLSCLRIPDSTDVFVRAFIDSRRDSDQSTNLIRTLAQRLKSDGDYAVNGVSIQTCCPTTCPETITIKALYGQAVSDDGVVISVAERTRFTLQLRLGYWDLPHAALLKEVARQIPSDTVTDLFFGSEGILPYGGDFSLEETIPAVFSCFPHVRNLAISGNIGSALYTLSMPQPDNLHLFIMPELSTLVLEDSSPSTRTKIPELNALMTTLYRVRGRSGAAHVRDDLPHLHVVLEFIEDVLEVSAMDDDLNCIRERMHELVDRIVRRPSSETPRRSAIKGGKKRADEKAGQEMTLFQQLPLIQIL